MKARRKKASRPKRTSRAEAGVCLGTVGGHLSVCAASLIAAEAMIYVLVALFRSDLSCPLLEGVSDETSGCCVCWRFC